MLDERGVWFIWSTLHSLGLPRASPHLVSKVVTSYAAQLEQVGLWDWGVYVAQHLPHSGGRKTTVQQIIRRNITRNTTNTEAVCEEEHRCIADHHVDGNEFHCARALRGRYGRQWEDVVTWYTAAGMYNSAHETLLQFLGVYNLVLLFFTLLYKHFAAIIKHILIIRYLVLHTNISFIISFIQCVAIYLRSHW